jgi:hypothetical protein
MITEDDSTASLELAMEVAGYFELTASRAKAIAKEVAQSVATWTGPSTQPRRIPRGRDPTDSALQAIEQDPNSDPRMNKKSVKDLVWACNPDSGRHSRIAKA